MRQSEKRDRSVPTIIGSKLALRPLDLRDNPELHRIFNQPGIMRYFPKPGPVAMDRVQRIIEGQLKHWDTYGYGWWAVEDRNSSELVGWCGLQFLPETGETEVAFMISQQWQGQGYATEAGRLSLEYGFGTLALEEIVGIVHVENVASQKTLEKIGLHTPRRADYFGMPSFRYALQRES